MAFDGSNDNVTTATLPPISTNSLTAACWLKPGVLTRGDLITKWFNGGNSSSGDQFDLLYGVTSGKPALYVNSGSGAVGGEVGSTAMVVGNWYHIVGTFDGSTVSIYLNGSLQASGTHALTLASGNKAFRFGNNLNSDGQLNGSLDDIRIYNRAIPASEVRELYLESSQGYPRGLRRIRAFTLGSPGSPGVLNIAGTSTASFIGIYGVDAILNIVGTSTTDFIGLGGTTAVLNIAGTSTALFNGTTNLRAPALIPWDEQDPRKRSRYHQQVVALLLNSLIRSGGIVEDQLGVFRLGYQPANNADWSLNQPRTVAEALDRIAALIGPIP